MTTMAMAGLLRNMSANLVGRSPGTVEYKITPTPPGKHDHTSRGPLPGPCPGAVLNCAGPVANQESEFRGVVIEIQQKLAGVCALMVHRADVIASLPVFVAAGAAAQELPPRRYRPTW
jgi:hypothetical protein